MNRPEFWAEIGLKILFPKRGSNKKPAITQTLTYRVEQTTRIGADRGLMYSLGIERPEFISLPSKPIEALVNLRREMKKEV